MSRKIKEDTGAFVINDKSVERVLHLTPDELEEDIEWLSKKLKGRMDTDLCEEEDTDFVITILTKTERVRGRKTK